MNISELQEVMEWVEGKTNTNPIQRVIDEGIRERVITDPNELLEYKYDGQPMANLVKDEKKIQTIKAIRNVFGWGLKDSKDYLDAHWDEWRATIVLGRF